MALLCGVMRRSRSVQSIVYVCGSMSTKTGVAPVEEIATVVATAVCETVNTSSPGPMSSARSAR